MLLAVYLLSIPPAFWLVMCMRIEDRVAFGDHDGGWWSSFKYTMRWSDLLASIGVSIIPVLNSVCALVCLVAILCITFSDLVGNLLSKPVFSRKVVIKMKKD